MKPILWQCVWRSVLPYFECIFVSFLLRSFWNLSICLNLCQFNAANALDFWAPHLFGTVAFNIHLSIIDDKNCSQFFSKPIYRLWKHVLWLLFHCIQELNIFVWTDFDRKKENNFVFAEPPNTKIPHANREKWFLKTYTYIV